MNCPRCTAGGGEQVSAYRGASAPAHAVALEEHPHAAGVNVQRCPSCRGAFVEYEDMRTIETRAPRGSAQRGATERAWDPPTEAIRCPSCQSETTRREWSLGTLLYVDVCVECRGVWLDGGELEAIGGTNR